GLNLLTEYDGQTITYDAIGNPLQYRGMNLTWSNGRELYSASKNGTTTIYRYNKDGMRNRKYLGDGTVIYQIQGSLISGEQKIGQDAQTLEYELEYFYDSDGNIISMLYNGTEYYYLKNIQGDIIGILDGSGARVVEYSYDSWGKVIEISGNQELGKRNPFRYRGYYYDEETGFYYVGSRYYDQEVADLSMRIP
ncbi:RHS repeat-associated core domain-containing protein, partial [bacterium]|nr:RHS repeat-associated core domain-containing protein [bacterium]